MWTPLGGWALVDPQERVKTVSKEDATRLREDALRLKEERREEVQIVSDSQVTVRPKVKTETSDRDESIVAGFNPLFNSSVIKEPPTSGKISSTGLRDALKKVLPGSSVPTQPAESSTPSQGDQNGWLLFLNSSSFRCPSCRQERSCSSSSGHCPWSQSPGEDGERSNGRSARTHHSFLQSGYFRLRSPQRLWKPC